MITYDNRQKYRGSVLNRDRGCNEYTEKTPLLTEFKSNFFG